MTYLAAEVLPGPGTVSRSGNVGLWLGPDVPEPLAVQLLNAVRDAEDASIVDQVKGLLAAETPGGLGSLALITVSPPNVRGVLHGPVVVQNARGEAHSGAFTSQILVFDLPLDGLIGVWGHGTPIGQPSALPRDLRDGTVPGGGLVLRGEAAPEIPPEPEPEPVPIVGPDQTPAAGSSIHLLDLAEPPPLREPLPVAGEPPAGEQPPAGPTGETVQGVMCVNGHFNHPDALYCRVCGIAMIQLTKMLVDGPRPALGVIVAANGSTYTVDRDYTVGRHPDPADGQVVVVEDERVSRRHARLTRSGWDLVVTDLNSSNGTYVKNPGWHDWMRVTPGLSMVVEPRGQIGMGSQIIVFESSVRPSKAEQPT
jgi:FHA domain